MADSICPKHGPFTPPICLKCRTYAEHEAEVVPRLRDRAHPSSTTTTYDRAVHHDGETCQDCNQPLGYVWNAPDWLWNRIMGGPGGTLCATCFVAKVAELLEASP